MGGGLTGIPKINVTRFFLCIRRDLGGIPLCKGRNDRNMEGKRTGIGGQVF